MSDEFTFIRYALIKYYLKILLALKRFRFRSYVTLSLLKLEFYRVLPGLWGGFLFHVKNFSCCLSCLWVKTFGSKSVVHWSQWSLKKLERVQVDKRGSFAYDFVDKNQGTLYWMVYVLESFTQCQTARKMHFSEEFLAACLRNKNYYRRSIDLS